MTAGRGVIRRAAYALLCGAIDTVFPSRCAVCGASVSWGRHSLCAACHDTIPRAGDRCPRCSGYLNSGACSVCGTRAWYVDENIVVADYRGTMRTAVRKYKFSGARRLARPFAELAAQRITDAEGATTCDIVTAVPMGRTKRWRRGYNQSEEVARLVARRLGVPYRRLLRENRGALVQKTLGYRERFLNILGRFSVSPRRMPDGARVLVVDDIFTTGATINECARVLKGAGARAVYGCALARAAAHGDAERDA